MWEKCSVTPGIHLSLTLKARIFEYYVDICCQVWLAHVGCEKM